jgi:outer membrane scaffolding protein for murein synthesis (MipA/OmpV family)
MKNQKYARIQNIVVCVSLVILAGMVSGSYPLGAQELPERNWSLWFGGGALLDTVYPGSDTLLINPIPYIQAEYTTRYLDFFAGVEDGIGVRVKESSYTGLSLAVAINPLGVKRDPNLKNREDFVLNDADEVKQFLEGTPTIESTIELFGTVALELPFGKVSSTASFIPISADYKDAGISDKDYNGLMVSLDVETGFPLTPQIFLQAAAGATWMNDEYAEAFHGIVYPTKSLKVFNAQSGMSDAHTSVALVSFFTEHIGALLYGSATQLLGDAADSPLTKEEFQPQVAAVVFYSF